MTQTLLQEETGDVDVFPSERHDSWEDLRQEIDSLFQHLDASQHVRGAVLLRLEGHSIAAIAERLRIGVEDVRHHLSEAGNLLLCAGVLEANVDRNLPPLPVSGGGNADSPLLSGSLSPGEFRRRRQSIWRQAPPPPKRRLRLTQGRLTTPTTEETATVPSTLPPRHPSTHSSRPLTPVQSFGWREVYYSEVHRYGLKR